jgi:hypothetical protein
MSLKGTIGHMLHVKVDREIYFCMNFYRAKASLQKLKAEHANFKQKLAFYVGVTLPLSLLFQFLNHTCTILLYVLKHSRFNFQIMKQVKLSEC